MASDADEATLGVSILVCVDPDAAPSGIWELAMPVLFGQPLDPSKADRPEELP